MTAYEAIWKGANMTACQAFWLMAILVLPLVLLLGAFLGSAATRESERFAAMQAGVGGYEKHGGEMRFVYYRWIPKEQRP